jgi:hypothetical protein
MENFAKLKMTTTSVWFRRGENPEIAEVRESQAANFMSAPKQYMP